MTSLFNLFQNISKLIDYESVSNPTLRESLICPSSEYNMNQDSLFLDIGSGFGKPVFHSALQVGCESKGIEVVPARVEFCIDFFYEFLHEKIFFAEINTGNSKKQTLNNEAESSDTENSNDKNKSPNENSNNEINVNTATIFKDNLNNEISSPVATDDNLKPTIIVDSLNSANFDLNFHKNINLNQLNPDHYLDTIKENNKSSLFIELRINDEIIHENFFFQTLVENNKPNKSILIENIAQDLEINIYDKHDATNLVPFLKYGKYFKFENISVEITPVDDYIYSNLEKIIINTIYTDTEEREFAKNLSLGKVEKLLRFSEIAKKIENLYALDFVLFVNTIFNGKKSILQFNKSDNNSNSDHNDKKTKNSKPAATKNKDLYEDLKEQLTKREKLLQENVENNEQSSEIVEDTNMLKQVLVDLKFTPYNDKWYALTSFVALDATVVNNYSNDKKKHYTHIYAYNKLMSKECRSKIAKILNKTKFKVLAWYSNPKQTKKAGLKNFTFLCKFPMQSTSTEKFHVYVYIKSK